MSALNLTGAGLARTRRSGQLYAMDASPSEHRHHVERRLRSDRRRGLDRRIADRRIDLLAFTTDRRVADRRATLRRGIVARRSWTDRRRSGPSLRGAVGR
jgi:hypothetical protein